MVGGDQALRFVPSRVEGLPGVAEVAVHPDRVEFLSDGRWVTVRLAEIARWPRPAWFWRGLARLGIRPRRPPVGTRDWFRTPPDRSFTLFTEPRITVHMPEAEAGIEGYAATYFRRVRDVLAAGGFTTFDLG